MGLGFALYAGRHSVGRVRAARIQCGLAGFPGTARAVVISDLHMTRETAFLRQAAGIAQAFDPDFVFLPGDLVNSDRFLPACLDWLSGFCPKAAGFAVPGNWEHVSGALYKGLDKKLEKAGFRLLVDEGVEVPFGEGAFYLAGSDDTSFFKGDPEKALSGRPPGMAAILLAHAPGAALKTGQRPPDLVLSGHTHGGQVRIPGYGPLKLPPGSGGFSAGLYEIGKTRLYVTRGLGAAVLPFRTFCPPEVTLLTLSGAPPE